MTLEQRYKSQFRKDAPKGKAIDYSGRMTPAEKLKLRHLSQFRTWPEATDVQSSTTTAAPAATTKPTRKGKK